MKTGSVMQEILLGKLIQGTQSCLDPGHRHVRIIVTGHDAPDAGQRGQSRVRISHGRRVGRWVVGADGSPVQEISGTQDAGFRLEDADMSRRVAGRMEDLQLTIPQIHDITIVQQEGRRPATDSVPIRIEGIRWRSLERIAHQLRSDLSLGQRQPMLQPSGIVRMDADRGELEMSSDVIPVDVGGEHDDGTVGEVSDDRLKGSDAEPCVDQCGAFGADEQNQVRLLPMARLAEDEGLVIEPFALMPSPRNGHDDRQKPSSGS